MCEQEKAPTYSTAGNLEMYQQVTPVQMAFSDRIELAVSYITNRPPPLSCSGLVEFFINLIADKYFTVTNTERVKDQRWNSIQTQISQ